MNRPLHWCLLVLAVLLLTVQILAGIIYIYSFFPLVWNDPLLKGVEPERETLFYALFLLINIVLTMLGVKWVLPKFGLPDFQRKFNFWLALEFVWCFLIIFCFFKWTTYRYPFWNVLAFENQGWLQPFFWMVCAMDILSKIFFPEVEKIYRYLCVEMGKESFLDKYVLPLQLVFISGLAALLYIPKPEDVVALGLAWDQWNHLDRVAGWFIKQGWPISYEQTIQLLVMAAIAYVIGLFYFIRLWLKSWLLASIGVLLAVKMGLFYYSASPCVWINPSNTFLTHAWDIALFFGFWYLSAKHPGKFYAAAFAAGIVLVAGWLKSNGIIEALGYDNQPMMAPLRVRQFFPYFMGYFVPLFYIFSLLVLMGQKQADKDRLPSAICIYGLMIFIGYLEHPMIGFYGSLMVPAIVVMLWWLKQLFCPLSLSIQRGAYVVILAVSLGALLTNRLMLTYPNMFFQDNKRFERERAFYRHFGIIDQSASLVRQLTHEDQKIVLLSNFETAILMKAARLPLFKDFPVMFSSMTDNPGGLNLKTKGQCLELINSIEEENAMYVFVDARLWAMPVQALGNSGLNDIMGFIRGHYEAYTQQGFLVALKRR